MRTKKIAIKGSTLALKPRSDVARDPKQWIFLQTHNIGNNPIIGISGFTGENQRPTFSNWIFLFSCSKASDVNIGIIANFV